MAALVKVITHTKVREGDLQNRQELQTSLVGVGEQEQRNAHEDEKVDGPVVTSSDRRLMR